MRADYTALAEFNLPTTWTDPRLVWGLASVALVMMFGAWLLARRRRGKLNRAAILCAIVSLILHGVLIALLPYASRNGSGGDESRQGAVGSTPVTISAATYSEIELTDAASTRGAASDPVVAPPLPLQPQYLDRPSVASSLSAADSAAVPTPAVEKPLDVPNSIDAAPQLVAAVAVDDQLDAWIDELLAGPAPTDLPAAASPAGGAPASGLPPQPVTAEATSAATPPPESGISGEAAGRVLGQRAGDFANRRGAAQGRALAATGGDDQTQAAVQAGIAWLSRFQRADGAWDPAESGAGIERSVLGQHRSGAGARATTGITGLALLSMLGAGHTHQEGTAQQSVRGGLQFLLAAQASNGSMAAEADPYARTYCHGMASLAMCEAAAMSGDQVALDSARSAIRYTIQSQHPTTGGWRYVAGDPGDTSQLGWQALLLFSGREANIDIPEPVRQRIGHFLRSVRAGRSGGLASYKPGEAPSRTMTAEALAIRLLIGEQVPVAELAEAEAYLLEEPPGTGPDNYYYWYYASLALHQLQDDAWRQWNERMKQRLLATQLPDGSWSTATVWGGHGGKVYTTAMACLCLEVYYRHAVSRR